MTGPEVASTRFRGDQLLWLVSAVALVAASHGLRVTYGLDGSFAYFDTTGRDLYWAGTGRNLVLYGVIGLCLAAVWKHVYPSVSISLGVWLGGLSWLYWMVVEPPALRRVLGDGPVQQLVDSFGTGSLAYNLYSGHPHRALPYLLAGHCVLVVAVLACFLARSPGQPPLSPGPSQSSES